MHQKSYYTNLRDSFLPKKLKTIFILESPPASGKYFYNPDGHTGELLFNAMMKFMKYKPTNKLDGLKKFQEKGYFIVDATYNQIDKIKDNKKRNQIIINDLPNLIAVLKALTKNKRIKIVPIKANVCKIVSGSLEAVGFNVINKNIPFPHPAQQKRFLEKLKNV